MFQDIRGKLVNLDNRKLEDVEISVRNGVISEITRVPEADPDNPQYLCVGLVDAHTHVESTLLTPPKLAELVVPHGTLAMVVDPHEIANVCGLAGIHFMISDAQRVPLKFYFGAPPCVPAMNSSVETAGAEISPEQVEQLLKHPLVSHVAEMMNFPGVLSGDPKMHSILKIASKLGKPVDGHAPGLTGADAAHYFGHGISTDHECVTLDEALDKLSAGLSYVLIREGSAARNLEALLPLLAEHRDRLMFCCDDVYPNDIIANGHIDRHVRLALERGYSIFDVLQVASSNPVCHYGLDLGQLKPGDSADFLVLDSLREFRVNKAYLSGAPIFSEGKIQFSTNGERKLPNNFQREAINISDISIEAASNSGLRVIEIIPDQIITKELVLPPKIRGGHILSDISQDVLKLVVVNRYSTRPPAVAFVHGFGLRSGALASSVSHDCHNIIAVGATDEDLVTAINQVIEHQGGLAVVNGRDHEMLPLPIAGLMSDESGEVVATKFMRIQQAALALGCKLESPLMTLSFLGLSVIPQLKLTDLGLFDLTKGKHVPIQVSESD